MRSTASNSFAMLLLIAPVVAVPLFAIFGIPQITPIVYSLKQEHARNQARERAQAQIEEEAEGFPTHDDFVDADLATERTRQGRTVAPTNRARKSKAELADDVRRMPASSSGRSAGERSSGIKLAAGNEIDGSGVQLADFQADGGSAPAVESAPPANRAAGDPEQYRRPNKLPKAAGPAPVKANTDALTWQAAVQRLNQMEIRNFRLEPGHQPNQFLFSCSYTPVDKPWLSYRFEAEANEPLRAVEKVLGQIDNWLAKRR